MLDQPFPLESAMIPMCIELIVQELTTSLYAPADRKNDAKENLSDVGYIQRQYGRQPYVARQAAQQDAAEE